MKYFFYTLCLLCLFNVSCKKNKTDLIFDEPVDVRLTKALAKYQSTLVGAPGWKLFVYPKGLEVSKDIKIGGLTYYLSFTDSNRVSMVSDFDLAISDAPKVSGYRIKALQRPSLIFDTYSYMHIAADPDPNVSLSPAGAGYGLGTDFNFSFVDLQIKDTILLKGNFNKSDAILIKATQAEMDSAYRKASLRNTMSNTFNYPGNNPYCHFDAGGSQKVALGFDINKAILSFSYYEGPMFMNKSMAYSYTIHGLYLQKPITIGALTFQEIFWDNSSNTFYTVSGGKRVEIKNGSGPVVYVSLSGVIGTAQYTTISVPKTPLPNQSTLFAKQYDSAKNAVKAGGYNLDLGEINFIFNEATKTMDMEVDIAQNGTAYLAVFYYTYTRDAAGNYKFIRVDHNGNGGLIVKSMSPLLKYFDNDMLKLEGISLSTGFLGQFTSIEHPDFYFTGNLY